MTFWFVVSGFDGKVFVTDIIKLAEDIQKGEKKSENSLYPCNEVVSSVAWHPSGISSLSRFSIHFFSYFLILSYIYIHTHTFSLSFILSLFHNKSIRWLWLETQNYVSFFLFVLWRQLFGELYDRSRCHSPFRHSDRQTKTRHRFRHWKEGTHIWLSKSSLFLFSQKRKTIANGCYEFFELNRINKSIEQKKWYRPLLLGVIHSRILGWKTHFVGLRWW